MKNKHISPTATACIWLLGSLAGFLAGRFVVFEAVIVLARMAGVK